MSDKQRVFVAVLCTGSFEHARHKDVLGAASSLDGALRLFEGEPMGEDDWKEVLGFEVDGEEFDPFEVKEGIMTDNDNILTEPQMHRVYDVARAVNVVNVKVEALRRQVEQHIAAADGADPVEGEQAADGEAPPAGESVNVLDLDAIESRAHRLMVATWECDKLSYTDQWQMVRCDVPALVAAVRSLRAERDEALARGAELEKEDTERLERGREKARHMEKEIATLKHAVRGALGNLAYGHTWTPYDTQYVRDAIAALSAALDKEATDAE